MSYDRFIHIPHLLPRPASAPGRDESSAGEWTGEGSPLARVYELDGWVLLLGVGFGNNTSMHLSEYRAAYLGKVHELNGASMMVDRQQRWVPFQDLLLNADDFPAIGESFSTDTQVVPSGKVGQATALLMPQTQLVDYAVCWMETHRVVSESEG